MRKCRIDFEARSGRQVPGRDCGGPHGRKTPEAAGPGPPPLLNWQQWREPIQQASCRQRLPDGAAAEFDNTKAGFRKLIAWSGEGVECIAYEASGPYRLEVRVLDGLEPERFERAVNTEGQSASRTCASHGLQRGFPRLASCGEDSAPLCSNPATQPICCDAGRVPRLPTLNGHPERLP